MSEPTVDLARRMPHPWCRDVSRDEAIRAAEDAAAAERTPLPDHRDLPQAVKEMRERVAELEAHPHFYDSMPHRGISEAFDALSERVARLEAVAQPRPEPTTGSESVTPAIDPGPGWRLLADDEAIEQGDEWLRPPVHLNVWEPTSVSQGDVQTPKTMDEVYRRRVEVTPPQPAPVPPADGLRTERVTLEVTHRSPVSVEGWALHSMLSLEGGESVRVIEETHFDDLAQVAMERNAAREECKRLRARVAELEAAAAANVGGEQQEPVAWGVRRKSGTWWNTCFDRRDQMESCIQGADAEDAVVLPLFSAPQQPRGWMNSEERKCLAFLLDNVCVSRETDECIKTMLARETPPRVKVPEWMHDDVRRAVVAAIREAGGEVE